MGSRIFISEPALSTKNRIGMLLLDSPPGMEGSSSPDSLVKPPRGMAFREYVVSPRLRLKSRGGKPIPNSSTFTRASLAVMKCPNSCANTSITSIPRKLIAVSAIVCSISFLYWLWCVLYPLPRHRQRESAPGWGWV